MASKDRVLKDIENAEREALLASLVWSFQVQGIEFVAERLVDAIEAVYRPIDKPALMLRVWEMWQYASSIASRKDFSGINAMKDDKGKDQRS